MRILVTGAAGFLGSHIAKGLAQEGHEIYGLDTDKGYDSWRVATEDGIEMLVADITRPWSLQQVPPVDAVIHLAAIAAPRECDANPSLAYNVNVNGTQQVLQWAHRCGATRFVLASSAHVYGVSPKYLPTDERGPLWLQDSYTITKILGEHLCHLYYDNHGLNSTILRLFNTYGPGQTAGYFVPDMIQKAQTGTIELKGAGVTKDFIYVDDVVRAFCAALHNPSAVTLNIGTGRESTLESVAAYIARKMGASLNLVPYDRSQDTRMQCDPAKAKRVLGWEPSVSLEEGLDATINASYSA